MTANFKSIRYVFSTVPGGFHSTTPIVFVGMGSVATTTLTDTVLGLANMYTKRGKSETVPCGDAKRILSSHLWGELIRYCLCANRKLRVVFVLFCFVQMCPGSCLLFGAVVFTENIDACMRGADAARCATQHNTHRQQQQEVPPPCVLGKTRRRTNWLS